MTKEQLINRKIGKIVARKRKVAGYTQEEVQSTWVSATRRFHV